VVAARAYVAAQLAADRGLVALNQAGDLRDAVLGFHKADNLVSHNLVGATVIHLATSAEGNEVLNAKHPLPR